jgi:hypothetical protein
VEKLAPLFGPGTPTPSLIADGFTDLFVSILAGLRAARPEVNVDEYLTPEGRSVLDSVGAMCTPQIIDRVRGLSIGELLAKPLSVAPMPAAADARAGRAAFTHPGFVLLQVARFLIVAAVEMQAVAVGWQVYDITKRPLDLGYVGLAQFLPAIRGLARSWRLASSEPPGGFRMAATSPNSLSQSPRVSFPTHPRHLNFTVEELNFGGEAIKSRTGDDNSESVPVRTPARYETKLNQNDSGRN